MTSSHIIADWTGPRSAAAFTGYAGSVVRDGQGGPSGTLALCVANTPIPCTSAGMEAQKFIQFTVLNIRKKGWSYAPWKKSTSKNAKTVRDDTAKELFEHGEWARDETTMERVGKSVLMYSFVKDGQAKGERVDTSISTVCSGQTFRVRLQNFMYEDKKGADGCRNVFPSDVETIPAFTVVEIMFSAANQGGFDQGYGLQVARVRPCEFTLYSVLSPLGLGLLPSSYEESVRLSEAFHEANQGLRKVLEDKNVGFFGPVAKGAYLMRYNEDFRLVGPKETPSDPQSRHLNAMDGGVFAIDLRKEDLLRFTNAAEQEEEDGLVYAQFVVELAAAAGALQCYVTYNEFLLRNDPNRSPFTGVPLIDTHRLLEFVRVEDLMEHPLGHRFPLPFDFSPLEHPFLTLEQAEEGEGGRVCEDLVLASENSPTNGGRAYVLTVGDSTDESIMRFLFVPKTGPSSGKGMAGRQDYRLLKKRKQPDGA